mmetsp:Transcript_5844/g.22890  ORF Transcript_5844/g.22890 Transcript_5844/m.22890 type:complete len:242 (-) Transcript_5844:616-1341(-)
MVGKRTHLAGQPPLRRADQLQRHGLALPRRHHFLHLTAAQLGRQQPVRRIGQAHARQHRLTDDLTAVGAQAAGHANAGDGASRHLGSGAGLEGPHRTSAQLAVEDAVVLLQVRWRARRCQPRRLEIATPRHHRAPQRADAPRNEAGVRLLADTHREVDALFDQVDKTIMQLQIHLHARVLRLEAAHQRQQLHPSEGARRRHAQPALQPVLAGPQLALGLGNLGHQAPGLLHIALASIGQLQ